MEALVTNLLHEETNLYVASVVLAVTTHIICQRHEPTLLNVLSVFVCLLGSLIGLAVFTSAGFLALCASAVFVGTLGVSVVAYRLSPFHPLYQYPGPFFCRVTQVRWGWEYMKGKPRYAIREWHGKYGDYVRIGPNELSIADAGAFQTIHGAKGFEKDHAYETMITSVGHEKAVQTIPTHAEHNVRRKVWDKAFSMKAVVLYQDFLYRRNHQLYEWMLKLSGTPINWHQWTGFYVYDVALDLAFGGGTSLLEAGKDDLDILGVIGASIGIAGIFQGLPWLYQLMPFVPLGDEIKKVLDFTKSKFEDRLKQGTTGNIRDVFHYLLSEDDENGQKLSPGTLGAESTLIIGAGADTTRTTMTTCISYLLQNPSAHEALLSELTTAFTSAPLEFPVLDRLPYLNAVINETLRLLPPVCCGQRRVVPQGGAVIEGHHVAGGISVTMPAFVVHHDKRWFGDEPDEFKPERWIEKDSGVDAKAFFPFGGGSFGCVGKLIALQELRLVIATTVMSFDLAFAPGFSLASFERGALDRFIVDFTAPLQVVLTKREGATVHIPEGPGN